MNHCTIISLLLAASTTSQAALLAHYDFTDGNLTDNEVSGAYTLNHVQQGTGAVTINSDGSARFAGLDGGNKSFLETPAFGTTGVANYTVSFWWKTQTFAQGNFQGLFSNDDSGSASFSWQLDSNGPDMRFVSNGNPSLTYPESNLSIDTWYHTVIRKQSGGGPNTTQVYITELGAGSPNLVMNQNANPGGLNEFRLGVNRNTDSLFQMDMANVKIYNDVNVSLTSLLAEGPQTIQAIPEPSSLFLAAIGGLAFILRRNR